MTHATHAPRPARFRTTSCAAAMIATLLAAGCGASPAQPVAWPCGAAMIGDGPWMVDFVNDGCMVRGVGRRATDARCDDLGERQLAGEAADAIGARAAAIAPRREETDGGHRAMLVDSRGSFHLEPASWEPLLASVRAELTAQRRADRERPYASAPACPAGQVVLEYSACTGHAGVSDVCGPPHLACGAPLAAGAACTHDAACASGRCGLTSATCE